MILLMPLSILMQMQYHLCTKFSATWLPQFSLSLFFSHFQQLGCHNSYFFSPHSPIISATWLSQLVSFQPISGSKNFGNEITEIQTFLSHTFCQNFSNTIAKIHSLSSVSQITLNSTHITNKLDFLQYLAKRLFDVYRVTLS